jgi:acetyl esterase/lipase
MSAFNVHKGRHTNKRQCGENATELNADPTKGFIVSGLSAGANLAAAVAHSTVDAKMSPPLTGVVLMSAPVCHPEAIPQEYQEHNASWEDHKDAIILDRRGINWFLGESAMSKIVTKVVC